MPVPELKTEFVKNSLFLVMDPWENHPHHEMVIYPWMDLHNTMMMHKILHYSQKIIHRCTSVRQTRSALFKDWDNFTEEPHLFEYMKEHSLDSIVYGGFHHGMCIVDGDLGCRKMGKFYRCYVKHDLSCVHPIRPWAEADERTAKFAEII